MPDAPATTPAPASTAPVTQAATAPTTAPGVSPTPSAAATTTPTTTPTNTPASAADSTTPGTGAKPADAAKALMLTLPEGSPLTPEHVQRLTAFAQKTGLSQEQAQAVLDDQSSGLAAHMDSMQTKHVEQVQAWDQSLRSDKDIGGAHLDANLAAGRAALEKFGTPELITALRDTGYNSFPPLVKLLVRIGKAMGEDTLATGSGAGAKSEADILAERYPTMVQKT